MRDTIRKLMRAFPKSFINSREEFIAVPKTNAYFLLEDCETPNDIKAKCLEWLSRDAFKTCPFNGQNKNNEYHKKMQSAINSFLGTEFSEEDFGIIYQQLGNRVNHEKTMAFIESDYDFSVLRGKA